MKKLLGTMALCTIFGLAACIGCGSGTGTKNPYPPADDTSVCNNNGACDSGETPDNCSADCPVIHCDTQFCFDCKDNDADGYNGYDNLYCPTGDDCNDTDSAINPGAVEVDDEKDNDCDGTIDGNYPEETTASLELNATLNPASPSGELNNGTRKELLRFNFNYSFEETLNNFTFSFYIALVEGQIEITNCKLQWHYMDGLIQYGAIQDYIPTFPSNGMEFGDSYYFDSDVIHILSLECDVNATYPNTAVTVSIPNVSFPGDASISLPGITQQSNAWGNTLIVH